jgi:DNA (cytosine-5)-methyltransferase 1
VPVLAGTLEAGMARRRHDEQASYVPVFGERARALTTSNQRIDAETETLLVTHSLRADGFDASEDGTGRGTPLVPIGAFNNTGQGWWNASETASTIRDMSAGSGSKEAIVVAFDARQSDVIQYGEKSGPLDTDGHTVAVHTGMQVRRLTPRECERLQGFPDDYTLIPYRGKPAADGPRYKALGNSMAVPCMSWIGRRIALVDSLDVEGG